MIATIYYIDSSIKAEFSIRPPSMGEKQFFGDLASAHRHGYCYLCGDSGSLGVLRKWGDITGAIYNTIYNHYAENGAAFQVVREVFVLSYRDVARETLDLPVPLRAEGKCRVIHIPTAIGVSWRLFTECCLLTENLDDSKFYQFIADYCCWKKNLSGFSVRFHSENGGGNSIRDGLEKCLRQDKMPVLCLVDSDQKYGKTKQHPQPAMGETLTRVQHMSEALKKETDLPPHALHPLYVHEIENLIPIQMLKALAQEQCPNMRLGLDRIADLQQVKCGEPVLYYDYKNGFPYMKGEPMRTYWKEVISALGQNESVLPPENKPDPQSYDPKQLFFPPLQSNILRHVIKRIENAKRAGSENFEEILLDEQLEPIWENLGELLLTWGYTNEPLRA